MVTLSPAPLSPQLPLEESTHSLPQGEAIYLSAKKAQQTEKKVSVFALKK